MYRSKQASFRPIEAWKEGKKGKEIFFNIQQ